MSFESVRLADALAEHTWPTLEAALSPLFLGLEAQLRRNGTPDRASSVFVHELRKVFSRDNITKAMAAALNEKLNADETRELATFMQTRAGQKYLQLNTELTKPRYFLPMVKQACENASSQLSASEHAGLGSACR